MSRFSIVSRQLGAVLRESPHGDTAALCARIQWLFDDRSAWTDELAIGLMRLRAEASHRNEPPRIADDPTWRRIWQAHRPLVRRFTLRAPPPTPPRIPCEQPRFDGLPALARWLGIRIGLLDNLANDWRQRDRRADARFHHYRYRLIAKRNGGQRLLEIPKPRLREIQRQIHLGLLARVPLHPACLGFRRRRSARDHALTHSGQAWVLRLDLRHFFNSIGSHRVHGLFLALGHAPDIASALSGICTHRAANDVIARVAGHDERLRRMLREPHLPQGSPASPSLANLCAFQLDRRLAGLAASLGLHYSRYADDLAFSGDRLADAALARLHATIGAIALDEGFALNMRKSRLMRRNTAQRVTGIVVNRHPNVPRRDFDRLKAILHNCLRNGFEAQNRNGHGDFRAHLRGRIAQVQHLNPHRGRRLLDLYTRAIERHPSPPC